MKNILSDKRLQTIFGITLTGVMGVASITPALPDIAHNLSLDKTQIGLLISLFAFPGIVFSPLSGYLADRWGRKTVLIPSLMLFGISGSTIFFIHDYKTILLLRILQGIGAAPLGALNTALIGDFFKGKVLPQAMGYNASVLSLSTALYPLIGGLLAGIAWYYPFLLPLIAIPVAGLALFSLPEPHVGKKEDFKKYFRGIWKTIKQKEIMGVLGLAILTFIILYGAFITYLPFLLKINFGMPAREIGIILSVSSLTTALLATQAGKLTWRFGSRKLLMAAFLLYALVIFLLPGIRIKVLLYLMALGFGAAQGLNIPSMHTLLAKLAPDHQRAMIMSLNGMAIRIGQTVGPLFIGWFFAVGGMKGAYYLAAIISLAGFFLAAMMLKPHKGAGKKST